MKCASRKSNLAKAQVREIEQELGISLEPVYVQTHGDRDLKTSLRDLDKTDFFTREVDAILLSGEADIAVHSAKDLPEPLPEGLELIYLSKGVDSRDALVMRAGMSLDDVKTVGTSSERRDSAVHALKTDVICKDIRGTIEARLEQLMRGDVDAVVIAEAALIRLNLTHLNRIYLPGETTPMQGVLAVLAKSQSVLYTGLDPSRHPRQVLHFPLIEIVPLDIPEVDWEAFTHFIITSRTAAQILELPPAAYVIAVGQATADALERVDAIASDETQEGIIALLEKMDLTGANICLPRSKRARREIDKYLSERGVNYKVIDLYDVKTKAYQKLPDLSTIEEIVFTSPSTVRAFRELFGALPSDKQLTAIGPVTKKALEGVFHE